jgi:hypothetical protein
MGINKLLKKNCDKNAIFWGIFIYGNLLLINVEIILQIHFIG